MALRNELLISENVEVVFFLRTTGLQQVIDEIVTRLRGTDIYQRYAGILQRSPISFDNSTQFRFSLPPDRDHLKVTSKIPFPFDGGSQLIVHTHHRKQMEGFTPFVDEIRPIVATLACIPHPRS